MLKKIIFILVLLKFSINTDCTDGTICPGNQKCCATKDGTSCCPYSSGVCCSDMKHCCPSGYTCSSNGSCLLINQNQRFEYEENQLPIIPVD